MPSFLLTFSSLNTLRKSISGLFSREKRSLYWTSATFLIWKRPIKNRHFIVICLLLILCFLTYHNSLRNEFLFDDYPLILFDYKVHDLQTSLLYFIPAFTKTLKIDDQASHQYYRPLAHFPLGIYYFFWGRSPSGYHLANLILFYLAALSVYGLIFYLFRNISLSFLTSVIFIVHPINGLLVNYITAYVFSLQIIFLNLAMVLGLKWYGSSFFRPFLLLGAAVFFVLAVLCHEIALIFPLFLAMTVFFLNKPENIKVFLKKVSIFFVVAVIYFLWRLQFASLKVSLLDKVEKFGLDFFQFTASYGNIVSWYFYKLITTQGIVLRWAMEPVREGWLLYYGILFLIALIAVYVRVFIKFRQRFPLLIWGLSWFLIGFFPIIFGCLFFIMEGVAVEPHWLFYSTIGAFACLAFGLNQLKKPFNFILTTTMVLGLTVSSWQYNRTWHDEKSYARYWSTQAPLIKTSLFYLASAYFREGNLKEARKYFNQAINGDVKDWQIYSNLCAIDIEEGSFDLAMTYCTKGLELYPESAVINNNLGLLHFKKGESEKAKEYYYRAISYDKYSSIPRIGLAKVYKDEGNMDQARQLYQDNLKFFPQHIETLSEWLELGFLNNNKEDVVGVFQRVNKNVKNLDGLVDLANLLAQKGYGKLSFDLYQKALKENPNSPRVYLELGKFFGNYNRFDDAVRIWQIGKKLDNKNNEFDVLIQQARELQMNSK